MCTGLTDKNDISSRILFPNIIINTYSWKLNNRVFFLSFHYKQGKKTTNAKGVLRFNEYKDNIVKEAK